MIVIPVPGNHDWFDGLSTYTRYILSRDWLGGWLMPQRTSYFALKLPRGWWALGLDLALDDDINIEQFHFFANLAQASMGPDDAVIIVSHGKRECHRVAEQHRPAHLIQQSLMKIAVPHWTLNSYEGHSKDRESESNLAELIRTHLPGKVKLRIAGDLHHYTRNVPVPHSRPSSKGDSPMLIVSGGGGAVSFDFCCLCLFMEVRTDATDHACCAALVFASHALFPGPNRSRRGETALRKGGRFPKH